MTLQFPSSPTTGQVFPSPLVPGAPSWTWDGSKWVSGGFSGAVVSTSPMPPTNPRIGDLWFDPQQGNTYVWFNDGNSVQWVIAVNLMAAPNLVPEPPADGQSYIRRNGTWIPMTGLVSRLAANVVGAANVWTNVLSIDLGSVGTWFVTASYNWTATSSVNSTGRLRDSATTLVTISGCSVTGGTRTQMTLSGISINPNGPINLTVQAAVAVTVYATSQFGAEPSDTQIVAMRVG